MHEAIVSSQFASPSHLGGDSEALLLSGDVYRAVRSVARRYMADERRNHTLQPTALVHEAWMRFIRSRRPDIQSDAQLIGLLARVMRQVLVNHAERHNAVKRGGGRRRCGLTDAMMMYETRCGDLVALDAALDRLAQFDPRQSDIVQLRFFVGMTVGEVAAVLGVSCRTVEREWTLARAWLSREVNR